MVVIKGGKERLLRFMCDKLLPEGCTFTAGELYDAAQPVIDLAAREDVPDPELVDARMIVDRRLQGEAIISANTEGVLAGGWVVAQIAFHYSRSLTVEVMARDGSVVSAGQELIKIRGPVAHIVTAERIFLNFLSRMSGIASLTRRCVLCTVDTRAVVTDTRKTLPAYRILDKYAVQCGGGVNHRLGLCDGVMIKDNHICAMEEIGIAKMVKRVRRSLKRRGKTLPIWVEVDRLDQLPGALDGRPDYILLDNMSLRQLRRAVDIRNEWFEQAKIESDRPIPYLEASGGIDLSNIADVARTGVDRIAVGALTHSVTALDLTLDLTTSIGQISDERQ